MTGIYGHQDSYIRGLGFYIGSGYQTVRKTKVYGDYNTGTKFEWQANSLDRNLAKVGGNAGEYLEKIKFTLTNG